MDQLKTVEDFAEALDWANDSALIRRIIEEMSVLTGEDCDEVIRRLRRSGWSESPSGSSWYAPLKFDAPTPQPKP